MEKDKKFVVYSLIGIGALVLFNRIYKMTIKNKNKNTLTKNFNWSEFESNDGAPMPADVKENIKELAKNLEVLREAAGKPIKINSGYRSPGQNNAVGGVQFSQHMLGRAADFVIPGMTTKQVHKLILELINKGKMKEGGLGLYPTWIHYDIRGIKARW